MKKIYLKPSADFEEIEEVMVIAPSRVQNEGTDDDIPVDPIEIQDPTTDPDEL